MRATLAPARPTLVDTQLTPVQAWLIGAIDQATLFDLIADDPAACRQYGLLLTGTDAAGT